MTVDVPPECSAARTGVSAVLDGEEPGLAAGWLTEHLVECADCRAWYAAARDLRRRTRLLPLPDVPRLDERILALVASDAPSQPPAARARRWRDLAPRVAAAVLGLALLWWEIPLLVLGRDPDAGVHPAHELGAFAVTLSACLLVAAVRPTWGHRVAPVFGGVALLLLVTAGLDLAHGGRTTWGDEAPHLLWGAAWLALWAMPSGADGTTRPGTAWRHPSPSSGPAAPVAAPPHLEAPDGRSEAWTRGRPA
jgi:predicted anti-sigma-YlaC factor YlaD